MLSVSFTGLDVFLAKLQRFNPFISKRVPEIMLYYGNKMVNHARQDHRFQNQSGNLERSISCKVDYKKWELQFYIDESLVMSGSYNYGWIQHDGSGKGYKASEFFKTVSPKLASGGIQHDHFLVRAFYAYREEMVAEMSKAVRSFF
jgi:hypothetical protein